MGKRKPLILVTNDDGYQAKGIDKLVDFITGLGEIIVVAPDGPRSGMSNAITSHDPIRYRYVTEQKYRDLTVYACSGTPVDCVKLGISEIVGRKPDLLLSGINHGSNAAISVQYSGTMGAVIEGCIFKIPSVGFSILNHHPDADFSHAEAVIRKISNDVIEKKLPEGICLNVNIPKGEVKGVKICRQTPGRWVDEFIRSKDGQNKEIFWLTGHFDNEAPEDVTTDEWALNKKCVSIVPVKIDITAHEYIDHFKEWENLK